MLIYPRSWCDWRNFCCFISHMGLNHCYKTVVFYINYRYRNIKESVFKRQIRFLSHPLGKLGVTYGLYLQLVEKRVLPIRDNWTFSLAFTADALIRRNPLCWRGWITLGLNIRFTGYISATPLPLEVFTQRSFVAESIRFKLIFIYKNDKFTFWTTLWGT